MLIFRRYLQIALQKNFLCDCLSVCLLICQSRPNGWRWTPHMGYHRITNFMKNVLGIIFCLSICLSVWLSVCLSGCLQIFAFNFFCFFRLKFWARRAPLLAKAIFKLKITPRLGLLRSFQLFESAALLLNYLSVFTLA